MENILLKESSDLASLLDNYDRQITFTSEDIYSKTTQSKSPWTATEYQTDINSKKALERSGILEALHKACALALTLEVPVGFLTSSVLESPLTDNQRLSLLSNSMDEVNHYTAFSNLNKSLQVSPTLLKEAKDLVAPLVDSEKYHPIFLSGFIELSLFFPTLAIFRKFGDTTIKLLAGDVSRDEAVHVRTNWQLIDDLNIKNESPSLSLIRKDIIHWLTSSIKGSPYDFHFWLDQSNRLINTRKAEGLDFTTVGQTTAFFEVSNANLAYYQA